MITKINKFQPLYNDLIESARKINRNSSIEELDNFNSHLGEMIGKFIYFSNSRMTFWIIHNFNGTFNLTQDQINAGEEQLFESIGTISKGITPDMIKEAIHSKQAMIIMLNETKLFFNISKSPH